MSKVWFGIIHSSSIDDNDQLYDNLIFTPSNYTIIGKLKNGGQLTIIKLLFYFDTPKTLREVDYLSLKLYENLHNTFFPVSLEHIDVFSNIIKELDYCENGIHPITNMDFGDPYNSENDSDYVPPSESSMSSNEELSDNDEEPNDEEEENDEDEENDEEETEEETEEEDDEV